jgi:hypothetical protein
MKKNSIRRFVVPRLKNNSQQEFSVRNIPVFLLIGLFLLALNISFIQIQKKSESSLFENPGQYFFLAGFPKINDGVYFLMPDDIQESFPELLPFVRNTAVDDANHINKLTALHYQSGDRPEVINPPPSISNIFFLPIPINSAGKEVLNSLPGIGSVLAERIIQRRKTSGPFSSKKELLQIAGIGPKKLAGLKDRILID